MSTTTTRQEVIQAEANYSVLGNKRSTDEEAMWRGDPEETFSDWKIVVSSTIGSERNKQIYNVHKMKLAHGNRKSLYFKKVFQGRFKESGTSNLEFHPLAASCFPKLLDFVYEKDSNIMIDTTSATALLHLGNYLEIELVQQIAEQFIRKDTSMDNIGTYLEHSDCFPEVNDILGDFVFQNLSKFSPSEDAIARTSLAQWERVATRVAEMKDKREKEDSSQNLSLLFVEFAKAQTPEALEEGAKSFQTVFSEDCMPVVHPDAALSLAEVHLQLPPPEKSTTRSWSFLDRFSHALSQSEQFQYQVSEPDANMYSRLGNLPGSFVATAWMKTEELDSKEHPRLGPMRRELESKLQPYSYEQVLREYQHNETKRRSERNAALHLVRAASPEASFEEIRASPQVQSIEECRVMEREVYDKILDAKSLEMRAKPQEREKTVREAALRSDKNRDECIGMKSEQDSTKREEQFQATGKPLAVANKKRGDGKAKSKSKSKEKKVDRPKGKDLFPVGTSVFHRDVGDGHGGLEYPACIVKSSGLEYRHITYLNYNKSFNRDVHISELLEWTQERQDRYDNETVPELKGNDKRVEELRRKVNQGGTTQSYSITKYVVDETYYLPEAKSGIEYPVKLLRICPKAKGKCCIKYVNYKTERTVPLSSLLPATKQREKKIRDHQDYDQQQKIVQEAKKKLIEAKKAEKQKVKAADKPTSSEPTKKATKKRKSEDSHPGSNHTKRLKANEAQKKKKMQTDSPPSQTEIE